MPVKTSNSEFAVPAPSAGIIRYPDGNFSFNLVKNRAKKNDLEDDIYEKDKDYMCKVYEKGLKIAENQGFKIINCLDDENNLKSIENIHNEIYDSVKNLLAKSYEK